jgi:hypothetical protein
MKKYDFQCLGNKRIIKLTTTSSIITAVLCFWKILILNAAIGKQFFFGKKGEICISGMPTFSKHSLLTHPKSIDEKRACLYNNQFQNWRHKPLTKLRTRGVTALERSVAKQFATGGFNQGLGVKPGRVSLLAQTNFPEQNFCVHTTNPNYIDQ